MGIFSENGRHEGRGENQCTPGTSVEQSHGEEGLRYGEKGRTDCGPQTWDSDMSSCFKMSQAGSRAGVHWEFR